MTHYFHHPECANDQQPVAFLRTPKKRRDKLVICPQKGTSVGWGLQTVEGWRFGRLWLLALAFVGLGTMVFAVCWSVFGKDLQGAFAVSAYIVGLIGLGLGTVQAHIM